MTVQANALTSSQAFESIICSLPKIKNAQLTTLLNFVFSDVHPDGKKSFGDSAFRFLASLNSGQATFVLDHSAKCPKLYRGLSAIFQMGTQLLLNSETQTCAFRQDHPQNVTSFIQRIAEGEGELKCAFGYAIAELNVSALIAGGKKTVHGKLFHADQISLDILDALINAVLSIELTRLTALIQKLFVSNPTQCLNALQFLIRTRSEEVKEFLKIFVHSNLAVAIEAFTKNYERKELETRFLCIMEAASHLLDQPLNWNHILHELCRGYSLINTEVYDKFPLQSFENFTRKVTDAPGRRYLLSTCHLGGCFLSDRFGRVVFNADNKPEIVSAWMYPWGYPKSQAGRGHLKICHNKEGSITVTMEGREHTQHYPLDLFFAGERISVGSEEARSFALYLISVLGHALWNINHSKVRGINNHGKHQWSELVIYYCKKFSKSIFSVLEEHSGHISDNNLTDKFFTSLFEDLSEHEALPQTSLMVADLFAQPVEKYDKVPHGKLLSYMGAKRISQYLHLLLKLANQNDPQHVELRCLRAFQYGLGKLPINDPLLEQAFQFARMRVSSLNSEAINTERIKGHCDFWHAALKAGLRDNEHSQFAINFILDCAYYKRGDNRPYVSSPNYSTNIVCTMLERISRTGEYPGNFDHSTSGETHFDSVIMYSLSHADSKSHFEGLDRFDVLGLVKSPNRRLKLAAIYLAKFIYATKGKDILSDKVFKLATNDDLSKAAISLIGQIYDSATDVKRAHILVQLIRRSQKHPKIFTPSLEQFAKMTSKLPLSSRADEWQRPLFEVLFESINHGTDIRWYEKDGLLPSILSLGNGDIPGIVTKILKLGERGDLILNAFSRHLQWSGCPHSHKTSETEFTAILTSCLSNL